jgi:hypothetical protein
LRSAVRSAVRDAEVVTADDDSEIVAAVQGGAIDLVLLNRELGYGFTHTSGVEMIR